MGGESRPWYPCPAAEPEPGRLEPSGVHSEAHLRVGSVAGLRALRAGLADCLDRAGCGPTVVADAQLVLAEIATNAFVHDAAPLVDVQITCRDDEVVVTTWHRGDVLPPAHPVRPIPPGPDVAPDGRGLVIVDRIVLSRDVDNDAGCTTTVVRMRR